MKSKSRLEIMCTMPKSAKFHISGWPSLHVFQGRSDLEAIDPFLIVSDDVWLDSHSVPEAFALCARFPDRSLFLKTPARDGGGGDETHVLTNVKRRRSPGAICVALRELG